MKAACAWWHKEGNWRTLLWHLQEDVRRASLKTVYAYLVMDILHYGHLRMLGEARRLAGPNGKLLVGILTDEAAAERKAPPTLSYRHRAEIAASLRYVDHVVPQTSYQPVDNIRRFRPSVLIESDSHTSDDICTSKAAMQEVGGHVVIIPYFPGISSTLIKRKILGAYTGVI